MSAADPQPGWVSPEVAEEFPDLRLWSLRVDGGPGPSSEGDKERMRQLSNRYGGARMIAMRTDPIPHAYRAFFRHIGLDPDVERIPVERAILERLMHGGFEASNRVDDALVIAVVETGVPVWALDAAQVEGPLGIRLTGERESLGRTEQAPPLREGRLVVADAQTPLAELFGDPAPGHGVTPETTAIRLFTVQPGGVPTIHVEEALWLCAEVLDTAA